MVLQFGPYRGRTLGEVAQLDPDHLSDLARSAQRPEVRVAARDLLRRLRS